MVNVEEVRQIMRQVALTEAKAKLSEPVDEVRRLRTPIVIQKRNTPALVLVEMDAYRRLQEMATRKPQFEQIEDRASCQQLAATAPSIPSPTISRGRGQG